MILSIQGMGYTYHRLLSRCLCEYICRNRFPDGLLYKLALLNSGDLWNQSEDKNLYRNKLSWKKIKKQQRSVSHEKAVPHMNKHLRFKGKWATAQDRLRLWFVCGVVIFDLFLSSVCLTRYHETHESPKSGHNSSFERLLCYLEGRKEMSLHSREPQKKAAVERLCM